MIDFTAETKLSENQIHDLFSVEGAVFCDIGARIGEFSIPRAHSCKEVYAFEPSPFNFPTLEDRAKEFGDKYKCFNVAFSDKDYESGDFLSSFAKTNQNELVESLRSPKIHGNPNEEYVLIPFCSFGSRKLKKCDLFKQQRQFYKEDQICHTFNPEGNYTAQSLHQLGGLNFAVNFRFPGIDLPVHLIVHSFNEIPNMDDFPATSHKILSYKSVTIGVEASITNVTSNFAGMSESKRNCFLNNGKNAFYSKVKCRIQKSIELAETTCKCIQTIHMCLYRIATNMYRLQIYTEANNL